MALNQCGLISDAEYSELLDMLPVLEDNPVEKAVAFTSRYTNG
jgi:hypothetical protein